MTHLLFARCDSEPQPAAAVVLPSGGRHLRQDVPATMPKRRYRSIDMPGRFVLEVMTGTGDWIDWGLYNAADFARDEDGAYFCQGDGSPLWLRCRRQDGSVLYIAGGGGEPQVYRMVPFPSDRYRESETD